MPPDLPVTRVVTEVEARLDPGPWDWAEANRAAIAEAWARRLAEMPALYNGPVLIRTAQAFEGQRLRLVFRRTDYASFLAAHALGWPDGAGNAFAMAAVRASDGACLVGEMAPHTANAGQIYFPAGTPDLDDVRPDGTVDLDGSVWRELREETGLGPEMVRAAGPWLTVRHGARTALMRELVSDWPITDLIAQARGHIAAQTQPELTDVHAIRDLVSDEGRALAARMPPFMRAYLAFALPRPHNPYGRPGD